MAETLKKSRIVSDDDNLEESLMEEFNLRLKSCMSQDDLLREDFQLLNENQPVKSTYENLEVVKSNGKINLAFEETHLPSPQNGLSSENFIQVEKESYSELPETFAVNLKEGQDEESARTNGNFHLENESNTREQHVNVRPDLLQTVGGERRNEEIMENVYENLSGPTFNVHPSDLILEDCSEKMQEETGDGISIKNRMFLSSDDASCLLFTQTVTSPMLTPSEENIDFLKGFRRPSQNTVSDNGSEIETSEGKEKTANVGKEENKETAEIKKSAEFEVDAEVERSETSEGTEAFSEDVFGKPVDCDSSLSDRVDAVENTDLESISNCELEVDFVQGNEMRRFRFEQGEEFENVKIDHVTGEEISESVVLEEPCNSCLDFKIETEKFIEQEVHEIEKISQGSSKSPTGDFTRSENDTSLDGKHFRKSPGEFVDFPGKFGQKDGVKSVDEAEVRNSGGISTNNTGRRRKRVEIDEMSKTNEAVEEKYLRSSQNEMVRVLKSHFMKNESDSEKSAPSKSLDKHDINELKSLDVMRQINKFENKYLLNSESEMSTIETSETNYVETIEIKSAQEKSPKKKKSKKSRSHEKENISVNKSCAIHSEEYHYNVNVKNLCRSFGDLTKLENEKYHNQRNQMRDKTMITKSMNDVRNLESVKSIEKVFEGVSVKAMKSSFNKFDQLQKKNILHVRSSDSSKAQEKFNGTQMDTTNCKACDKQVFQMEQIKAEKCIWHKNCFRCKECSKQLNVDTYESHEGSLYCKPHFKSLFAPKIVEDEEPPKPRKHQLIIAENQPQELPPDVVRASDKPDLGLEELQSLNVKERFQVFEQHEDQQQQQIERNPVNVKRSASILSKLARFQAKGMDVGVSDEALNGIPIEVSSSEEEEEEEVEGEDADLVKAKRVQKEKPFHFTGMSDVKSKWEHVDVDQSAKDERREERKQEIQSIRNRLFMGKQGKMKEMYQQAVMESEVGSGKKKELADLPSEVIATKSIKEKFERGAFEDHKDKDEAEDMSVFESGISKKSRSIFLELDANASKAPQISPVTTPKISSDIKKARDVLTNRQLSEDVVKSSEQVDDVAVRTADIQERFKFFETYKEPVKTRKEFRITPPRDGQVKSPTPDREIYRDPDIVRAEEYIEDSVIAKETHTATKMLNKFRQMEENLAKESTPAGPKPLKRFTPPPEPSRQDSSSEVEGSGSEDESEECEDEVDRIKTTDADLLEAKKAARARQLRAKFEKWEANEIKREQNNSSVNIAEELGDEQAQMESTKVLRARFESMRETTTETSRQPRVKVNRFVDTGKHLEHCQSCKGRVYPLEKISVHNAIFHKTCFKCMECSSVLRMDSYSYNQGLLYCIPHFKRLFITKGNYDTAFGLEQHKEKWNAGLV